MFPPQELRIVVGPMSVCVTGTMSKLSSIIIYQGQKNT